jgi:ADP-heptose:LPS heptosyltransferase
MRLLAIRFSSMGDVALTVPVLRGVLKHNPDLQITMVSNGAFEAMFHDIERLTFYRVDLKNYDGFKGLFRLYRELKGLDSWEAIIDLHSVMRTWVLGGFFKLAGVPVFRLDKGRAEKKALVRRNNKVFKQLKHTTERYLDVFKAFGVNGEVESGDVLHINDRTSTSLNEFLSENGLIKDKMWLGLAPFSKHKQKTWPLSKITALIEALGQKDIYHIFLLGGAEEAEDLRNLAALYPHCINMAGVFSLDEEIALMHQMDGVVAMDSFNMHLAALCNTKVISIWGGTHRFAGFGPLNNNEQYVAQVSHEKLACRPCSVFGRKPCYRGDWACLKGIEVDDVLKLI